MPQLEQPASLQRNRSGVFAGRVLLVEDDAITRFASELVFQELGLRVDTAEDAQSAMANMAKHAGLPWDLILSAEVFRHYKPDPQTYLGVADVFGVTPEQVMLVASHEDDLDAAAACGLQTAYVARPLEHGPGVQIKQGDLSRFTLAVSDFNDLADRLSSAPA